MINIFLKIFRTPKKIIHRTAADSQQVKVVAFGEKIQDKVKRLFRGSLAIRQVDAGSDNACEQG